MRQIDERTIRFTLTYLSSFVENGSMWRNGVCFLPDTLEFLMEGLYLIVRYGTVHPEFEE